MSTINLLGKTRETLSILKNPFVSSNINNLNIFYFTSTDRWTAEVNFKNGNTSGTQSFEVKGAENFFILQQQMQDFINSL